LSDSTHGIAWKGTAFKRANHLVLNVSSGTTALDADLIVSAEEGSIAGDIFVADAMVATFAGRVSEKDVFGVVSPVTGGKTNALVTLTLRLDDSQELTPKMILSRWGELGLHRGLR